MDKPETNTRSETNTLPQNKKKQPNELWRALSLFSQIGLTMAACVMIGVFLGKFLDGLLGTSPWLLLIFSMLGVFAAIKAIYDLGMKKY